MLTGHKRTARPLSLRRQLLLSLMLPQLLLWLVGGTLAYRMALSYAEKAIDQSLTQSLRSLARQVKPVGSGLLIDLPKAAQAIIEEDPQDKVSYMVSSPPGQFVLGNATLPPPPESVVRQLRQDAEPAFYQAMVRPPGETGRPLRLASMELQFGAAGQAQRLRVQVAKSLAVRERIARELVRDMLVPLVLLGLVLGVLVYVGIARGLQPLARLQAKLQAQSAGTSSAAPFLPIELRQAPQEVHSLAAALNQLLGAVQRSVSQEKRFVNDAAHQLRTPLAGLQTQLALAVNEPDPALLHERLKKVQSAVERSGHLVHQLLQLARSEADVPMQVLDAVGLARQVAQDAAPRALAAGADFGFESPQPGVAVMVRANALLLREALGNLIDNAIRYAGPGAIITLRAQAAGGKLMLRVEDNGAGLTAAQMARLFERFYRASELPGGAGLGLAIVQEIAHRHGGQASAEHMSPQGLAVTLTLPQA